ncbi:Fe-S cluster assembly protein SufD [[Limnothrix rosea] IAM M-220]|nr:Fe-S cluster assembly protein SufD [[Limnothrix rosea] IAM M-220]
MTDVSLAPLLRLAEELTPVFNAGSTGWLREVRLQGAYRVSHGTFPTRRDEDWRVTDVSILKETAFRPPTQVSIQAYELDAFNLDETAASRLVFVNGIFSDELSETSSLPEGIFVGNLAALPSEKAAELVNYLSGQSRNLDVFAALNDAGIHDAAVIWAEKNVVVEQPIQVLFVSNPEDAPIAIQSRCVAIAESGASFNLVEYYGAVSQGCSDQGEDLYFNNALTEVWVKPNGQLNHIRVQREAGAGIQIGNTVIDQAQDSRYKLTEINMGGQLSRHTVTLNQTGVQTDSILKGLTMLSGSQVSDTHTSVNLNHPHGTVDQLHKCIVDDSARSIFNGKVDVPQAAQMTNAAQLNRNLLLSSKARIDTKPELQITADNVKCAHGATVSQLEADEIFYLRSRGLNEYDARHLLIDAFAAEILGSITIPSLQNGLTNCVACRTIEA